MQIIRKSCEPLAGQRQSHLACSADFEDCSARSLLSRRSSGDGYDAASRHSEPGSSVPLMAEYERIRSTPRKKGCLTDRVVLCAPETIARGRGGYLAASRL